VHSESAVEIVTVSVRCVPELQALSTVSGWCMEHLQSAIWVVPNQIRRISSRV
jgi:hypothetical protein